jgi:hypothetical protein
MAEPALQKHTDMAFNANEDPKAEACKPFGGSNVRLVAPPEKRAWTLEELHTCAQKWMKQNADGYTKEGYYTSLGLLVDFVSDLWAMIPSMPENENQKLRAALQSLLDWGIGPDDCDDDKTKARFMEDVQRAKDILSNIGIDKPNPTGK